ncbi:MAG TPA: TIGR03619 family F420-dependent LLM class oxidoreductase [Acidimicrobiia bacterium]|jgi:probable F420-dependent oxidoreductase|nr:TIGR03619 family F420-dependent LLM class oxidoreductase [Acidimicrobiia bacterium]
MSAATLTVGLANYGSTYPAGEWHRFVDLARAAEDAGVDRIVLVDHVVMGEHTENYVWGKFPVPPNAPWFEPLTMLSAIASVTSRVRLATGILIAPLRPAAFLAKQVATLDQISNGRVDLGVGAGWQREEYEASGLPFEQRGQLLTDTLGAMKALWRDTPASFSSPTLTFENIYCEPKPLQQGGVPLWVAGTLNRRNFERVVNYGDGWIPIMGATIDDIDADVQRIRAAWADAGRDADALKVQAPLRIAMGDDGRPDLARSMESVPELVAAGVTDVNVALRAFARDTADAPKAMEDVVRRFHDVA